MCYSYAVRASLCVPLSSDAENPLFGMSRVHPQIDICKSKANIKHNNKNLCLQLKTKIRHLRSQKEWPALIPKTSEFFLLKKLC